MLGDALLKNCVAIAIAHVKMTPMVVTLALAPALNRASFARVSQVCYHAKLAKEIVNAKTHRIISCFSLAWSLARRRGGQGPYVDHADVSMHIQEQDVKFSRRPDA